MPILDIEIHIGRTLLHLAVDA